jgi:hypothetical protein
VKIVLLAPQSKAEPYVIGEMKEYNQLGRNTCVSQMIRMITDLEVNGYGSSYIKHLGNTIYELKSHTRGGHKGGARVYFFVYQGAAIICACECKDPDDEPDQYKLNFTAHVQKNHQSPKENQNETS